MIQRSFEKVIPWQVHWTQCYRVQNCSNLTMTVLSKNQTVAGASCPVTAGPGTMGFTGPTMIRPNNPDCGLRLWDYGQ